MPANRKTLERLNEKYRVTTLILDREESLDLTSDDILASGLRLCWRVQLDDRHYLIYRRPTFAGEEDSWLKEMEVNWSARLRRGR